MGVWGDDPITTLPVLWLRETSSGWRHDPVFRQNIRTRTLLVKTEEGGLHFTGQPYSDADVYWEDPGAGSVVVVRRAGEHLGPGETELMELSAVGDTVWTRRMKFDPVRLTRPMVDAAVDDWNSTKDDPVPREVVEDALHLPEYLPAVRRFHLTSSGHIWIQSHERQDTLSVWYSLDRGDNESPPRRVLLPEWFQVFDATDTHVWGVWEDELDINYVVGRRLVPAS